MNAVSKLRDAWESRARKDATEAFAEHSIVSRSTRQDYFGELGSWHMRSPQDSPFYWVEIVELAGGRLIVHGDINFIVLKMYDVKGPPGRYARWMDRPSPSDTYLREKAHDSRFNQCQVYQADIAAEDARVWLSELDDEDLEHQERLWQRRQRRPTEVTFREAFGEACRRVASSDLRDQQAAEVWSDLFEDSETWDGWGWVTSSALAHAWAALRRLSVLLAEEDKGALVASGAATILPLEG